MARTVRAERGVKLNEGTRMPVPAGSVRGQGDPDADLVAAALDDPGRFVALYDRHVRMGQG